MNVKGEAVIINYKSKSCQYQLKTKTRQNISQLARKLTGFKMQLDTEFSLKTAFRPYFVSYQKLVKNRKSIGCCRVHSSCVFTLGRFSFEFCSFFITVVTCPVPSPSSGTRATCPRNATVLHNAVYYNTTCQFSCEDGYVGFGSQVRRCQRNGTWSGQNYSCQSRSSKLGNDRYVIYIPFYFVNNHRQVSTFGVWWE